MLIEHAAVVRRLAQQRDERAWLVGGTVRDMMLGRSVPVADMDVALAGDAVAFGRELADATCGSYVPLAEEHGTARVVCPDGVYDVSATSGATIELDLARRDLTINAMAVSVDATAPGDALIDPFGGLDDLRNGVVRAVSEDNLTEDPLRVLRVFRFASTLGFRIDPATLSMCSRQAPLLARPAAERVTRELFLTLAPPRVSPVVRLMDEAGVLSAVLPETRAMRGVTQNEYHHLDVWEHSLEALACLEDVLADLEGLLGDCAGRMSTYLSEQPVPERPRVALLKLTELLHDLGKPPAREIREGRVTFYEHTRLGADMMRGVCERMRLSRQETEQAVRWVDRHLVPGDMLQHPMTERRLARFFRREGQAGLALMLLVLGDAMATRGPAATGAGVERMRTFSRTACDAYYTWGEKRIESRPLVTGRDLMRLGMQPGPEMGVLLRTLRAKQDAGDLTSREEALAYTRERSEIKDPR